MRPSHRVGARIRAEVLEVCAWGGGAWTWHCAALQAPRRSCTHECRGGPLMLSFLGVGGVGGEVNVAQVGVLLRKV